MDAKKQEQLRRFEEAARALGCNEDEAAFDAKLAVIVRHKPKAEAPPKPARKPPKKP